MILFSIIIFLIQSQIYAFDYPYTMRSPEGLVMGDAYTAVNADEFTLFYNPASLGRHKKDFTFYPFNPQFNGTNIFNDVQRFKEFQNGEIKASEVLMDYPIHASAGIAPGFKLFNVGVSFFASENYDLLLRNNSHPMLDMDIHSDKGILIGTGIPIGKSRVNRQSQSGSQTSLGLSFKYIERKGFRETIALLSPEVAQALSSDGIEDLLDSFDRVKGVGYGFDAGIEHVVRKGSSQFILGLSALDIGGIEFREESHPDRIQVSDIRDQLNLGIAVGQDFKFVHYILSADARGLNEETDFGKRIRLGAQIGIPGFNFMGGINSGYYSIGASVDLIFMKLTAGLYGLELGTNYQQTKSSRFVVYLSLFDFSFDA